MRFVFLSYINTPEFYRPQDWIDRINAYTGILEFLSRKHAVISIEQIDYQGEFLSNGVHYHFQNFGKRKLRFPLGLHHYVKALKPDMILVHGLDSPLQVMQLRMQLGNRIKIIVQNHAEKPGSRYKKVLQQLADRVIDAYLFTSKEMGAEWVSKGIIHRQEKIREVMEASSVFKPIDRMRAKAYTGVTGNPIFLWVGRLDQNKDPCTVVKAFLKFVRSCPGARLYMLYHTTELLADIEDLLGREETHPGQEEKYKEAVVLVGKKPHEEMLYWYNAADFIISGSHYEGSGVAICEAMSCGCIPIVTNILSFKKITGEGRCGLLYQPGNEQALLSVLLQSRQLNIKEERGKVLHQFREELSFEAIAGKIHQIAVSL
jgi:glycosyltransferase involved in cell wall biosynthesis